MKLKIIWHPENKYNFPCDYMSYLNECKLTLKKYLYDLKIFPVLVLILFRLSSIYMLGIETIFS